ncbi:MAG: helix-turn-helix domain-containing protein, partial [Flavonifractor plautii]
MYEHLKALRESLGMTQAEFGESVGVAKSTYNNYEIGARDPKSDFWIAVAQRYGVTIDYLMGFSDDPKKTSEAKNAPSDLSEEALHVARDYEGLD